MKAADKEECKTEDIMATYNDEGCKYVNFYSKYLLNPPPPQLVSMYAYPHILEISHCTCCLNTGYSELFYKLLLDYMYHMNDNNVTFRKRKKEDAEYHATLQDINEAVKYAKNSVLNHDSYLMVAAEDNGYDLAKYRKKIESDKQKDRDSNKSSTPNLKVDKDTYRKLLEGMPNKKVV